MIRSFLVLRCLVVATAANKASLANSRGSMRIRSINTEILFNMSSRTNIRDSLNQFGGQDSDTTFLVASLDKGLDGTKDVIEGEWGDINGLPKQIN